MEIFMFGRKTRVVMVAALSFTLLTGFGLKDLKKKIAPDTDKCENRADKSKCKNKERLKSAAKVVAIGVAAKIIYDMVVEYTSIGVKGDHEIVEVYLKENKKLPKVPTLIAYKANILPNATVKVGKPVTVKSSLSVVPGRDSRTVKIEEKIEIFDNEDDKKVIKSLTKTVNGKESKAGAFENEFSFTLPKGMPQGVYPIKTAVVVDGKLQKPTTNKMQLVLHILEDAHYQIAYLD